MRRLKGCLFVLLGFVLFLMNVDCVYANSDFNIIVQDGNYKEVTNNETGCVAFIDDLRI